MNKLKEALAAVKPVKAQLTTHTRDTAKLPPLKSAALEPGIRTSDVYADFWAANPIEGETVLPFAELTELDKRNYTDAIAHVVKGGKPRTKFERYVAANCKF